MAGRAEVLMRLGGESLGQLCCHGPGILPDYMEKQLEILGSDDHP